MMEDAKVDGGGTALEQELSERLDQLLDFYAFLIQANGLMARVDDIDKLYCDICELGIHLDRRLVLAWVGIVSPDEDAVRVVASAGPARGYLTDIRVLNVPTDARGRGPTGLALREGRCVIVNRFQEDPLTVPWREQARNFGIAASASIPLRRKGQVFGALMLYAGVPDVFDERIASELDVLSQSMSYAVDAAEEHVARQRAEAELRDSLAEQRALNHQLETAQNQLLQAEKMASLGQLAAGVAHEINNPIGFVNSNLGTLANYMTNIFSFVDTCAEAMKAASHPADFTSIAAARQGLDIDFLRSDIQALIDESKTGLERVRKIVQDLKDFTRPGETAWQWADINGGIESTLNVVSNELKYKCEVVRNFGDLPRVHCMPSQINQVFMSLLINAGQAIATQGKITITTACSGAAAVRIVIADTGVGIAPENLKRIFEPFYTTKPVGTGTGLGLSQAWGIVQRHGGTIEVASQPGRGTAFTITLPRDPAAAQTWETKA